MKIDNTENIIFELVQTRVNGNQIKGNKTYENMLKRVTKVNIKNYNSIFNNGDLYGTKLEMIEQIVQNIKRSQY